VLLNLLKFVYSSNGMKFSGYNFDCVVFGVSWCREFVYVLQCGCLHIRLLSIRIKFEITPLNFFFF
jgi:hypothetical protein